MNDLMQQTDDIDAAMPIEPAKAAQWLLYIIAGLVVFTLAWAAVAKLDRVTRGEGRVITANQLQQLQYLEGGIVKEILVRQGQRVAAGDVLVKLDPTQMNVEFAQGTESEQALLARIARLEAEADDAPMLVPTGLETAASDIVARERALFNAREAEKNAALEVELSKLEQRREALQDAKVALETAEDALRLAEQEHELVRGLVSKGIEPQVELLRARQREAAARGEAQRAEIAVTRTEFEIAEAQGEVDRIRKTFAAAATDELAEAKAEMAALKGELPALRDKVDRTDVRAPLDGVVHRVLVTTVGGVVKPGETIVELAPVDDTLLIEAKIRTKDIGFLRVGQKARVSITAYDSAIYGALDGVIEVISPDAVEDEKSGERFYLVKVRTAAASLSSRAGDLAILPGMAAEVAVLNGKRTVLSYLLNPISKVSGKALREQ